MYKNLPRYTALGLLSVVFVLSGCQLQLLPPANSMNIESESITSKDKTVEEATDTQVANEADNGDAEAVSVIEKPAKPAKRATVSKDSAESKEAEVAQESETSEESKTIDAIISVIEAPAEDSPAEAVAEASEVLAVATAGPLVLESVQAPPTATPAPPIAYVTGSPIRIHAGPGDTYALHGIADQGTTFALVGQANDCQWYQVQHSELGTAWLSSTGGNVTIYNATCPQLPATN